MLQALLIDDNPDDLLLVSRIISKEFPELEIQTAANQIQLESMLVEHFDLVVTDYHLGFTTGLEVKNRIKSKDPNCPVIVFTITASEDEMLEAMKSGLEDYVLKTPKQQRQMVRAVRQALAHRQERLQRQGVETQLNAIIQDTREAIIAHDAKGRITEFNAAAEAIFGYSNKEAIGRLITKLIVPLRSRNKHLHEIEQYQSQPPKEPFKTTLRRGDGELFSAEVVLRVNRLEPNETQFVYQIRDLSQIEQTQTALKESEQRFRGLIEHNTDGVVLLDPSVVVGFASPSNTRLLGYPNQDLLKRSWLDLAHPEDRAGFEESFSLSLRQPNLEIQVAVRLRHANGNWRFCEGVLTNMLGVPGVLAVAFHYRDETDRRRYEQELELLERVRWALRYAHSSHQLAQNLLDEVLQGFETDAGCVMLSNPATYQVVTVASKGWFSQLPIERFSRSEGIAGWVLNNGKTYVTSNFAEDTRSRPSVKGLIPPNWGGMALPLLAQGKSIGVLFVALPQPRGFSREERRLLERVAELAAHALQSQLLQEENEKKDAQLASLKTIEQTVASDLDLHQTLEILLQQSIQQLDVDAASVLLFQPNKNQLVFAASQGFKTEAISFSRVALNEQSYAGSVALQKRSMYLSDLSLYSGALLHSNLLNSEGFVAYWAVPLIGRGGLQGVLELFKRSSMVPLPQWEDFMQSLALQAAIAIENARMHFELQGSELKLEIASDATIEALATAVDLRDHQTQQHANRVAHLTVRLARALGLPENQIVHIRRGALLHDIGKLALPDSVLHKSGSLTKEEQSAMQKHPEHALQWLSKIEFLQPALDIPYSHHERWDGSGYPQGLVAESIPLAARIFSVVDTYDALISERIYKAAWPKEQVMAYLQEQKSIQFDPRVVDVFVKMMESE